MTVTIYALAMAMAMAFRLMAMCELMMLRHKLLTTHMQTHMTTHLPHNMGGVWAHMTTWNGHGLPVEVPEPGRTCGNFIRLCASVH